LLVQTLKLAAQVLQIREAAMMDTGMSSSTLQILRRFTAVQGQLALGKGCSLGQPHRFPAVFGQDRRQVGG
jgi:hypothetical protein